MFRPAAIINIALTIACASTPESDADLIPGIGPLDKVVRLHTGLQFTEGPATDGKGNVYFTDIPANKIYKIDRDGKLGVFSNDSNHANGLMFNASGELVACEMDGQVVAWDVATRKRRVIAGTHQGKRFNAPNDLVIDQQGGVYFTDPHFRAPKPLPQGKMAVYYVGRNGEVTRLVDDLPAPNGVILSPDEKTLYVFPSLQAEMMAYPVDGPGVLGAGRVFCRLKQSPGSDSRGADGVAVDTNGNLYITTHLGLQVVDSVGKLLGVIPIPEKPANVAFAGDDGKTLFVTARTSVYTVNMESLGHQFLGATPKLGSVRGIVPLDGQPLSGATITFAVE